MTYTAGMNVKRLIFKIVLGFVLAVLVFFVWFVWLKYRASERMPTPPATTQEPAPASPPATTDRAFVTIGNAPMSADRGGTWIVTLASNSWSRCLVDLYTPDEKVSVFPDPALAEAVKTADGSFTWTWNVPKDAGVGTWTARVLCGSTDDLASHDVKIEVK